MDETSSAQDCTVYVSNFPFSLTNNDLHQIFQKYGTVNKVTIVKDRQTRKSKGVAFVVFKNRDEAEACILGTNQQEMYGRILKSSIAKDNGRSEEFSTKKKSYETKSRCFECGEEGHLSYQCPKNALGIRELPKQSKSSRKHQEVEEDDTLSAAIRYEQQQRSLEEQSSSNRPSTSRKRFKPSSYFSDEEELSE